MQSSTKKIFGLGDITLLTFLANFGLRWLAVAAAMGSISIVFWILGAILLAMPFAYMCAKLSQLYPEEGGLYAWVRNTLGEKNGFVVAWLYFLNNLFYYPAILIFLATNFAYFLGHPALANNSTFVCTVVLIAFWLVILTSLFGLKANKFLTEYAGVIGVIVPALLIIGFGVAVFCISHHSATSFTWQAMLHHNHLLSNLSNLSMLMFAMTGVEIIPTFANSVRNPKRDLYIGLLLGMIAVFLLYLFGTIALNVILSPHDIHKASGLIEAFQLISVKWHLPWMTKSVALMVVFAELAAVSIWLIAPITMFFKCTPMGLLPRSWHALNKKQAPANALLLVGVVVTLIVLTTQFLPAVNDMYQILVLMSALLVFIPYLYLVWTFVKNQIHFSHPVLHHTFSICVTFSLILGIIFSFELPGNVVTLGSKILYESELFFGPLIFMLIGYWLFARWQKQN